MFHVVYSNTTLVKVKSNGLVTTAILKKFKYNSC